VKNIHYKDRRCFRESVVHSPHQEACAKIDHILSLLQHEAEPKDHPMSIGRLYHQKGPKEDKDER
jgi:hypothetical protein